MPTVQDILARKGDQVHTISPAATVLEATQRMNQHKIGALLVVQDGQPLGMFTERDVLRKVVAQLRNPSDVSVADTMTAEVVCCEPDTDLEEAAAIMQQRKIRHLPVCDRLGNLHGMISIGDLNAFHVTQQEMQISFLNDYIYGRA